jgi:hypothetical protein
VVAQTAFPTVASMGAKHWSAYRRSCGGAHALATKLVFVTERSLPQIQVWTTNHTHFRLRTQSIIKESMTPDDGGSATTPAQFLPNFRSPPNNALAHYQRSSVMTGYGTRDHPGRASLNFP